MTSQINDLLFELVNQLSTLDDDNPIPEEAMDFFIESCKDAYHNELVNNKQAIFQNLRDNKLDISILANELKSQYSELKEKLTDKISKSKAILLDRIFSVLFEEIDALKDEYSIFDTKIYFQLVHPNAKMPTFAHKTDACADAYCPEEVVLPANSFGNKVNLGFRMAIPDGWEIQVRPRSGMSCKTKIRISNTPGTVDSGYLGDVCVLLDNLGNEDYVIKQNDRIAQLALRKVFTFEGVEVKDINSVKETDRGQTGFGDSGR